MKELLKIKKTNILGTEYKVRFLNSDQHDYPADVGGYCDSHSREIYVRTYTDAELDCLSTTNLESLYKKILRHEIIHAVLHESGLSYNSMSPEGAWAMSEEMVDWWAIQSPKIFKIFSDLNIM